MNRLSLVWTSEWIKLRSVRSTWWAVGGAVLAMAVAAALNGTSTANEMTADAAPPGSASYVSVAIGGVNFVQFIVPVPAMLLITSEYATRSITFSLQCVPARTRLLLGKASIVAAFGFALGTLLGAVGVAVGVPALAEYGQFSASDTIRSVMAIGLYSGLISIVALGVGTFTRSSAATVSILFLVLLVASTLLDGLAEVLGWDWLVTISTYFPNIAGQIFITWVDQPYSPLIGLLTLAGWAAAALLAGAAALNTRDAEGFWPTEQPSVAVEQPSLVSQDRQLDTIPEAQPGQHRADMRLDRALDHVQPGCDLRIRQPGSHQPNHVALAVGQAFQSRPRAGRTIQPATPMEVSDDAVGDLRREVCAPG
jgi:ABC-2 type transport system permease protein